ncbi:MAG: hypothetical protein AB9M53_03635 [Leptothrix sp. (in: b-proteobacteria)]
MRNRHTPLMKTLRQWQPLNRELRDLAAEGSLDLLTLSAPELAGIRSQAFDLVRCIDAWCETHRPVRAADTLNPSIQGA